MGRIGRSLSLTLSLSLAAFSFLWFNYLLGHSIRCLSFDSCSTIRGPKWRRPGDSDWLFLFLLFLLLLLGLCLFRAAWLGGPTVDQWVIAELDLRLGLSSNENEPMPFWWTRRCVVLDPPLPTRKWCLLKTKLSNMVRYHGSLFQNRRGGRDPHGGTILGVTTPRKDTTLMVGP